MLVLCGSTPELKGFNFAVHFSIWYGKSPLPYLVLYFPGFFSFLYELLNELVDFYFNIPFGNFVKLY